MVGAWLPAALCATFWTESESRRDGLWDLWKNTHQKEYQSELEEAGRRALWEKNMHNIILHNLEASLGLHTYTLGINHFSDLTEDEKFHLVAPLKIPKDFVMTPAPLNVTEKAPPASVDWASSGYVTSVKNQGPSCRSCSAFSAAGALEGLLAKTTGSLKDLSPQNLVDCSWPEGNKGCAGGWAHQMFEYVRKNHGINSEAIYSYEGKDGPCRYKPSAPAATCSSFQFVKQDELSLQNAVAAIGPISVVIDSKTIAHYHSGVYNDVKCGKGLNHAVLVVGYGRDRTTGMDYWLIKNSWGPTWGEHGYLRLARNKNQMCGISLYSTFPQ